MVVLGQSCQLQVSVTGFVGADFLSKAPSYQMVELNPAHRRHVRLGPYIMMPMHRFCVQVMQAATPETELQDTMHASSCVLGNMLLSYCRTFLQQRHFPASMLACYAVVMSA